MNVELEKEFLEIIDEIVNSDEFKRRKKFRHHENESVYEHSLSVAYLSYRIAKYLHCDVKSATIAGLLHDFYPYPWQYTEAEKILFQIPDRPKELLKQHGFTHAREALENARKYYPEYMNERVEDAILRHMFPLNIHPPKYRESWIVTFSDKFVSAKVLKHPSQYYKYVGLEKIVKKFKKNYHKIFEKEV